MGAARDLLELAVLRKTSAASDYIVQAGDTLGHISQRLGATTSALADFNSIADPNRIRAGQRLRIPASPQSTPPPRPPRPPQQPPRQPQPPQPPQQPSQQPSQRVEHPGVPEQGLHPSGPLQSIPDPRAAWGRAQRRAVQEASYRGRLFDGPYPELPSDISPEGLSRFVAHWEGFEPEPYRDTRGLLTVGYGTLLEGTPDAQRWLQRMGGRVTPEQALQRKQQDLQRFITAARRNQPNFDSLPPEAQALVVDLNYNLGSQGYAGFRNTRDALSRGDWDRAADELIDSQWFAQVGRRSRHHVDVLRALAEAERSR